MAAETAAKAYVLLRTAPGLTKAVYSALRVSPAVQSVEMITGPYDLIVAIKAASANEILTTIMQDIRPAAGIRDTLTCLVV
ncbi:MAG: Lrp/AsnC ligand binding domain-containing protein, partial [Anaerolineae bacterium]